MLRFRESKGLINLLKSSKSRDSNPDASNVTVWPLHFPTASPKGLVPPDPRDEDHITIFVNNLVTVSLNESNWEAGFKNQLMLKG